jgi:hypothetical protein
MIYDALIIIPTYNRYGWLTNILEKLFTDLSNYTFKVIVYNDCSSDIKYSILPKKYPHIHYIKSSTNGGKHGYWKSINTIFNAARNYNFKYMIQIDDDFDLCDNFINTVITLHEKAKQTDAKIVACGYTRNTDIDRRWGLNHWVDGGFICDVRLLDKIKYTIDKIPKGNASSGVWKQLSHKIINNGYHVGILPDILITHLGHTESKMHKIHRIKNPIVINKTI